MKNKKCLICGKEFATSRPNKKYCCLICKEAAKKFKRLQWEEGKSDYMRQYMRQYRAKQKQGQ
jgi:hypothetical protein